MVHRRSSNCSYCGEHTQGRSDGFCSDECEDRYIDNQFRQRMEQQMMDRFDENISKAI